MDIGIELVEFFDIDIENVAQIRAHGVVEFDGDIAAVITAFGHYKIGRRFCFAAGEQRKSHCREQHENKKFFHGFIPFVMSFISL